MEIDLYNDIYTTCKEIYLTARKNVLRPHDILNKIRSEIELFIEKELDKKIFNNIIYTRYIMNFENKETYALFYKDLYVQLFRQLWSEPDFLCAHFEKIDTDGNLIDLCTSHVKLYVDSLNYKGGFTSPYGADANKIVGGATTDAVVLVDVVDSSESEKDEDLGAANTTDFLFRVKDEVKKLPPTPPNQSEASLLSSSESDDIDEYIHQNFKGGISVKTLKF